MRRYLLVPAFAFLASASLADEGRIPIYQPVVITEPGSYFLSRNIVRVPPIEDVPLLTIAANDVDVDFKGHTVTGGPDGGIPVAVISVTGSRVRLHSGTVTAGVACVSIGGAAAAVEISNMFLTGCSRGVAADGSVSSLRLQSNHILAVDRGVVAPGKHALIIDNWVRGPDTAIAVGDFAHIQRNRVFEAGAGTCVSASNWSRIEDNIIGGDCAGGITAGNDNHIEGNTVEAISRGITIVGSRNRVTHNLVRATHHAFGVVGNGNDILSNEFTSLGVPSDAAVEIDGSLNRIEANSARGQYGLNFAGGSQNFYRNNVFIGNGVGGVTGDVASQIDGGGNVP